MVGRHDIADRFQIPKKLYGRQSEVDKLLSAFERTVQGGPPELLLVSGYSGIGKTALIYEVYKPSRSTAATSPPASLINSRATSRTAPSRRS